MRRLTLAVFAGAVALSLPMMAQAGPWAHVRDRVEDRIDRRENIIDERVNHGPRDVLEDKIDRWEDRRDRANLPTPRFTRRWEHRSWRRIWGN